MAPFRLNNTMNILLRLDWPLQGLRSCTLRGGGATSASRAVVVSNKFRGIGREVRKGVYNLGAMAAPGDLLPAVAGGPARVLPDERTTSRGQSSSRDEPAVEKASARHHQREGDKSFGGIFNHSTLMHNTTRLLPRGNWAQSQAGSLPDFGMLGDRTGRCRWSAGFFSGISRYPLLHSGAAPYSPRCTLIGSQDLTAKSPLNLVTHSLTHSLSAQYVYFLDYEHDKASVVAKLQELREMVANMKTLVQFRGLPGVTCRRVNRSMVCHPKDWLSFFPAGRPVSSFKQTLLSREFGAMRVKRGERGVAPKCMTMGENPEKTLRPAGTSGPIATCEDPGAAPPWNRTRFALVGGGRSSHCPTAAPTNPAVNKLIESADTGLIDGEARRNGRGACRIFRIV
ncbi:hypothetical protein PR048_028660 [Dryococelus australis]|uniref:Uncharacterized protein n=1 Tax=Dryococelus australis TaxID=614101 RepID=A0ABQ9GDU6_9NEOP|nr:hypothetical protein PR048_028660 [Dryococelus australis]